MCKLLLLLLSIIIIIIPNSSVYFIHKEQEMESIASHWIGIKSHPAWSDIEQNSGNGKIEHPSFSIYIEQ